MGLNMLREYLSQISAGPVKGTDELESLLINCWHEFKGSNENAMAGYKLRGRMEKASWQPPILSFVIERHGGTVLGSTRAELQTWDIDIADQTANCYESGHRQLIQRQPRLNVMPIAEEVVRLILSGQPDARLKWNKDGNVYVKIGEIIDASNKQTMAARRKRFRAAVEDLLIKKGWQRIRPNLYSPPKTS